MASKIRITSLAILGAALPALALSSSGLSAQAQPALTVGEVSAAQGSTPLTADQAAAIDTSAWASSLGISEDEMRRQLALQDAMDTVDFAALDPGFAEIGSAPGKTFRIWYRSALQPTADLKTAMDKAGILPYVDFVQVPLSLPDLQSKASALFHEVRGAGLPVGMTIDTATGGVVLHAPRVSQGALASDARQQAQGYAAASGLPYSWGQPAPEPAFIGGKLAGFPGGSCTGAFTVHIGTNNMMSSAAHCGNVGASVTYAGNTGFTVTDRSFNDLHDVLIFDKSTATYTAEVNYGATVRNVYGTQNWTSMHIGDQVSKYGQSTGFTVGTITDLHSCGASSCSPESLYVNVANLNGNDMCSEGDSGGPFMAGSIAYGITSSRSDNHPYDCQFMPQDLIYSGVGATVLTQ